MGCNGDGNIVISHATSVAYWRSVGSAHARNLEPCAENPLEDCARPARFPELFDSDFPAFAERPVHLLVPDKKFSRHSQGILTHVASTRIPQGAFFRIGRRLYTCSPSLTAIQMASFCSLAQLIELISQMTADYYIHPRTLDLARRTVQIASCADIRACALSVAGSNGAAKTEKAAGFALEHARSPMEIKAGLLMSLPRSMGGFQFPRPVLNYKVPCEELRAAVEQDYFLVDIAYSKRQIGVEYFGRDTHPDPVADRRRINGLRALGWEILTLDRLQLYDPSAFMVFARQLSLLLGHQIKTSSEWIAKHMRLRADLDLIQPSLRLADATPMPE